MAFAISHRIRTCRDEDTYVLPQLFIVIISGPTISICLHPEYPQSRRFRQFLAIFMRVV
jgi:hypothetical protein